MHVELCNNVIAITMMIIIINKHSVSTSMSVLQICTPEMGWRAGEGGVVLMSMSVFVSIARLIHA